MLSCQKCYYARYAPAQGKIACGYLSGVKHGMIQPEVKCPHCNEVLEGKISFSEFFDSVNFKKDEVYEGWAGLTCAPKGKPTILTRDCIIVDPDNLCQHFRER